MIDDDLPNMLWVHADFDSARKLQLMPSARVWDHAPLRLHRRVGLAYKDKPGRSLVCRLDQNLVMAAASKGRGVREFLEDLARHFEQSEIEEE